MKISVAKICIPKPARLKEFSALLTKETAKSKKKIQLYNHITMIMKNAEICFRTCMSLYTYVIETTCLGLKSAKNLLKHVF